VKGLLPKMVADALQTAPHLRTGPDLQLIQATIGGCDFFQQLHFAWHTKQVCRSCGYKRLHKNELLFNEGDDADKVYIVCTGHVRVVVGGICVCVLGPGTSFGEKGVLGATRQERQRTATIVGGAVPGVPGAPPPSANSQHRARAMTDPGPDSRGEGRGSRQQRNQWADLAVIEREDYLRITHTSQDSVRAVLMTEPKRRTQPQLQLLLGLFSESPFFASLGSKLMMQQVCRSLQ
jgi:hypothetical protein